MPELQNKKGEIGYNNFGTPMKIVSYNNCSEIEVMFLDQNKYKTKATYSNFKRGTILNPYDRTTCGVGYLGEGKYKKNVKTSPFNIKMHTCWEDMIKRCYDENIRHKHLAYQECFVADIWHNYQNFAEWYKANFYQVGTERMHLDKDILYKNNKFYSPENCLIVPQRINMIFMKKSRSVDADLPTGINRNNTGNFKVSYNNKYLGVYDNIEEAIENYNIEKYRQILEVAKEYEGKIPPKLYEALVNWIPDGMSKTKYKQIAS